MPKRDDNGFIVVLTTLANPGEARSFVRRLVEARIVACGTVIEGATSLYRWKNRVQEEAEALVLLKTQRDRWNDLQQAVSEHHPYDLPELLALPVVAGLPQYLEWLTVETRSREDPA